MSLAPLLSSTYHRPTIPTFQEFEQAAATAEASGASTSATAGASCNVECQKRRREFQYVTHIGKAIYAYWDEKIADTKLDFDAFAKTLEATIVSDMAETDYYVLLRRWAASFHDGHVNAILKADSSNIAIYTAPLRLELLGAGSNREKLIVSRIAADHDSGVVSTGARVGDEVVAVDDVPTSRALDEAEQEVSGSTRRMRRRGAARRLVDAMGALKGARTLKITLLSPGSRTKRDVYIPRSMELKTAPEPKDSLKQLAADTGLSNFKNAILPGALAYLRIDAFSGSQSKQLLSQFMDGILHTQGLLLDVRRNGGGDQSGNEILSRLASAMLRRYRVSERLDNFVLNSRPEYFFTIATPGAAFAPWHDISVSPAPPNRQYLDKPVVVLIGPDCFSACDTFVSALKVNRLAEVVGESTGGGTGTPLAFELPFSKHSFRYSVVRGKTADDGTIEGEGTHPDVEIVATQAERAAGKDQQLIEAIAILKRKVEERLKSDRDSGQVPLPQAGKSLPELEAQLRAFGDIWQQDLTISPSRAENAALRAILANDEEL